ncbi:hypothetical protein IGS73_08695 [Janibacter indicus]|uniref:Uncharacterized protein n=1 Tax=Janibacter indicus TaxID=857417 RepID=A0A7L9J565_9MICO|nr:hypothetical protein [Janibacter indicus]QOK24382.1 hypothetical protein IGS73_08695 [Janibacter indicus]
MSTVDRVQLGGEVSLSLRPAAVGQVPRRGPAEARPDHQPQGPRVLQGLLDEGEGRGRRAATAPALA